VGRGGDHGYYLAQAKGRVSRRPHLIFRDQWAALVPARDLSVNFASLFPFAALQFGVQSYAALADAALWLPKK
jgi:hypothetical protein